MRLKFCKRTEEWTPPSMSTRYSVRLCYYVANIHTKPKFQGTQYLQIAKAV